jgi:hypothetical protein
MKKIVVATVIAIWCVPTATFAGERVGDAALGALSGAVVLGPVGAVAGAVIGYTAGPSIADSWGLKRSEPRQSAKLPAKTTSKRVSSTQGNPPPIPVEMHPRGTFRRHPSNLGRLTMPRCPSTDLRCNSERHVASIKLS